MKNPIRGHYERKMSRAVDRVPMGIRSACEGGKISMLKMRGFADATKVERSTNLGTRLISVSVKGDMEVPAKIEEIDFTDIDAHSADKYIGDISYFSINALRRAANHLDSITKQISPQTQEA